uniref:Uncharacterized protein n=1 Tax=Arundo donax TaxID=35708 RepID=A0A0A9CMU3_ARUDO
MFELKRLSIITGCCNEYHKKNSKEYASTIIPSIF